MARCPWEGAGELDDQPGVDTRHNGSECRQMMPGIMLPRCIDKRPRQADCTERGADPAHAARTTSAHLAG